MTAEILERDAPTAGTGGRGPDVPIPRDGGGDRGGGAPGLLGDPRRFAVLLLLGTISMLFLGFTSAYMLRRASADWVPISAPALVWLNTLVLALSSVSLEAARRRFKAWDVAGTSRMLGATGALGALFVVGQVAAWRGLAAQGAFLASSPHSSFFYVLTGAHALHLLGGLAWFGVLWSRLRRLALVPGSDGVSLFALYWHYLGVLWLYLALLLFAT